MNPLSFSVLKDSPSLSSLQREGMRCHLTCCQDEVTVPGYLDGGRDCGHLKVLNQLNPALHVWGGISEHTGSILACIQIKETNADKTMATNSPTSFFWSCLFFRSDSHYMNGSVKQRLLKVIGVCQYVKMIYQELFLIDIHFGRFITSILRLSLPTQNQFLPSRV